MIAMTSLMNRSVIGWFAALSVVFVFGFSGQRAYGATVLPPGSTVAGKTIGEWSASQWQWAVSFDTTMDNPFTDTTGEHAGLNQSGPVFYLAGTTGGSETRSFSVPAGLHILVPLLVAEIAEVESPGSTPAEIRTEVNNLADLIDELHASIDGVPVPDLFSHREESPDFSMNSAPNNIVGLPAGDSGVAVADGYWLMLEPLSIGETFVLNFGGAVSSFGFSVDATDTITVVPEPATATLGLLALGLLGMCYRRRKRV
jgi:hypothetical protein